MSDLSNITGNPIEIEIGGRKLRFAPITIGDLADFESWVISERINQAVKALGDNIRISDKVGLIQQIQSTSNISTMSELSTVKGILHIIWLALRKYQPEITEEEVGNIFRVKDLSEMQALVDALTDTGGADDDDSKNATTAD